MSINFNLVRGKLRSEGRLIYAMFDFNASIMLPPTVKKENFRLPYYESWVGSYSFPCDTEQGEFDYNPFVFDVGVLGLEMSRYFQVSHYFTVLQFFPQSGIVLWCINSYAGTTFRQDVDS